MSGIATFMKDGAAYLLTDTAATENGVVSAFVEKSMPLLRLKATIGFRGANLQICEYVAGSLVHGAILNDAVRFNQIRERLPILAKDTAIRAKLISPDAAHDASRFELYIAGISDAGQPRTFRICSYSIAGEAAAFEPFDLPDAFVTLSETDECVADFRQHYVEGICAADLDPVADGIRLFEIARRHKMVPLDGLSAQAYYGIGGEIIMTKITANEISVRTIHRWADQIGQPIRVAHDS